MNITKLSDKVWQDPAYFIAFGFGTGLLPLAPGTWGTLAAIPLYLLMAQLPIYLYLSIVSLAFFMGVLTAEKVSTELGVEDYSGIVWDEVVGYLLTMAFAPFHLSWMILGFILFRIFDIFKCRPIRYVEKRFKGGMGVMLDDVLAAVPACFLLQFFIWIFHS